jgi:predicted nuclease of predicted toxin-antitoxin system
MRFLVDAQIPKLLSVWLNEKGFHSIHTSELPNKNSTTDDEINKLSFKGKRIVITKDADFLQSFKLSQQPYKLLLITTGNISNRQLKEIFEKHFDEIISLFKTNSFIELTRDSIIVHQ